MRTGATCARRSWPPRRRVVAEHGLQAVTMPRIAAKAGIAEVRLCPYFPDLDAVMRAWHERQVANHLGYLDGIGGQPGAVTRHPHGLVRDLLAEGVRGQDS